MKKFIPFLTTIVLCTLLCQNIGQYCIHDLSSFKNTPFENSSEKDNEEKSEEEQKEKRNEKDGDDPFAYLNSSRFNSLVNGKFDYYKLGYYELIPLDQDTPPPQSIS